MCNTSNDLPYILPSYNPHYISHILNKQRLCLDGAAEGEGVEGMRFYLYVKTLPRANNARHTQQAMRRRSNHNTVSHSSLQQHIRRSTKHPNLQSGVTNKYVKNQISPQPQSSELSRTANSKKPRPDNRTGLECLGQLPFVGRVRVQMRLNVLPSSSSNKVAKIAAGKLGSSSLTER